VHLWWRAIWHAGLLGQVDYHHQHAAKYGVRERGDLWTCRHRHQVQGRGRHCEFGEQIFLWPHGLLFHEGPDARSPGREQGAGRYCVGQLYQLAVSKCAVWRGQAIWYWTRVRPICARHVRHCTFFYPHRARDVFEKLNFGFYQLHERQIRSNDRRRERDVAMCRLKKHAIYYYDS
jgi:hypothetical protein